MESINLYWDVNSKDEVEDDLVGEIYKMIII